MNRIAPSEKDTATVTLEKRLWDAADQLRANSGLKSLEYSAANRSRYIGVASVEAVSHQDFKEQLETLNEQLETPNAAARELEATIANNVTEILEA